MSRFAILLLVGAAVAAASDESIEARMTALEDETRARLTALEDKMRGTRRAGEIGFTVRRQSTNTNVPSGSKVPYNSQVTNEGGGWDQNNLQFVAPEEGLYAFYVMAMHQRKSGDGTCRLTIYKDGTQVVNAYSTDYNSSSQMAVLKLAVGDKVYVAPAGVGCDLYGEPWFYNSFSGFKIA